MFKEFDRNQDMLLPPSLQELIPLGDLVYFITEVVEYLDLKPLIRRYDPLGQNAYHPAMLLAVLFYAYARGIFSSRKIAEQLRFDVRFMYLAGMQTPDFRTISDFRKNNLQLIKKYFADIVLLGKALGIATLREIAVDGTKIAASASPKRMKDRDQLAKQLAEVEAEIARLLEHAQSVDSQEDLESSPDNPVLAQLKDLQALKHKIQEAKARLDENAGQKEVNLTDMDCRHQLNTGPGYNGQIAVDAQSQFIVYEDVTTEPNDNHQLVPMVEGMEADTDSVGQAKTIIADSGYASAKAYRQLEANPHLETYVPTKEQVKRRGKPAPMFDKSNFTVDLQEQTAQCPLGHPMRYLRRGVNKSGEPYINFIGVQCPACPAKFLCTKAKYRNLVVLQSQPLIDKMEKKMETAAGKWAMRLRKQSVEPVFGILKEQMGFRRFHLRGLKKVKGEFALLCTSFNLKKLHSWVGARGLAGVLAAISAKILDFLRFFAPIRGFFHKELRYYKLSASH